ncbi:MAG: hypothetical protein ACRDC7_21915 [Aeromonas veronii]
MSNTLTPRVKTALNETLSAHAEWCRTGRVVAKGRSLLARLMEFRGQFVMGAGVKAVSIEERVEGAMMRLAVTHPMMADVVRMEHGAGWINVMRRRAPKVRNWQWNEATQDEKAAHLGLKGWEYRVLLAGGQSFIIQEVTK